MRMCLNEAMFCLRFVGFDGDDIPYGAAVGKAESGLDTDVIGLGTLDNEDLGWLQCSTKWNWTKLLKYPNWRDPFVNAAIGRMIWLEFKAVGKPPWSAWHVTQGSPPAVEKHLPFARDQFAKGALWSPTPDGSALLELRRLAT